MKYIVCDRCGKTTDHWHYVYGKPVCADDRTCYKQKLRRKGRNANGKIQKCL